MAVIVEEAPCILDVLAVTVGYVILKSDLLIGEDGNLSVSIDNGLG